MTDRFSTGAILGRLAGDVKRWWSAPTEPRALDPEATLWGDPLGQEKMPGAAAEADGSERSPRRQIAPPPAWENPGGAPAAPAQASEFAPPPAKRRILRDLTREDVAGLLKAAPQPWRVPASRAAEIAAGGISSLSSWETYEPNPAGAPPAGIRYPYAQPQALPALPPSGPAGEKSGEDMGTGMATGLQKQSSLVDEQARQILASVQAILAQGVELPVRIDTSGVQAQVAAVRTRAEEKSRSQVEAMLRSTYADTEWG